MYQMDMSINADSNEDDLEEEQFDLGAVQSSNDEAELEREWALTEAIITKCNNQIQKFFNKDSTLQVYRSQVS